MANDIDLKARLARIQEMSQELAEREKHPLLVYRPQPQQLAFHESGCPENILRGGKRAGKTLAVVCELGSRILGIPITRPDGTQIPLRYPHSTQKSPKLYWCIAFNIDHIGQTVYHRLFSPGLGCNFYIIRDLQTNKWRAFEPDNPDDKSRESQRELCPPMFGDAHIVPNSWHMDSRAGNVFKAVKLTNGATICAYPSTGDHPKQGDAVDGVWIDEDITNERFLKEYYDRLQSTNGWFLWSVWPHAENFGLIKALDRAAECEGEGNPKIRVFTLTGSENIYNSREGVEAGLARMDDDDDVAHRDRGDISHLLGSIAMYDFHPGFHILKRRSHEEPKTVQEALEYVLARDGRFPRHWTRYLGIDPSHTRTACLFGVVPPPEVEGVEVGQRLIIEAELIVRKKTPKEFAEELAGMCGGLPFDAFVMDQQIGRIVGVGMDTTVFKSYSKEFRKVGLESRVSKSNFIPGCNVKATRRRQVRELLRPAEDGCPRLLLVENTTVGTQVEFRKYQKKRQETSDGILILDDPVNERQMDAMACHDSQTEVLTSLGWRHFASLTGQELLATVNLTSDEIEYQLPTARFAKHYSGEMVHFGGLKMDALVTPGHRMVSYPRKTKLNADSMEPRIRTADGITKYDCLKLTAGWSGREHSSPVLVPRVFNCMGLEKEIEAGLLAEFMGWFIAEGCIEKNIKCPGIGYRVNIAQVKENGIVELKKTLDQLPWKWTKHKSGFSCSSKQLWSYLQGFGYCYDKFVPEWIKWASRSVIERFVNGAVAGDGTVQFGRRSYFSTSKRLCDDMQELFLKLGVTASIRNRGLKNGVIRGRKITATADCYHVLERVQDIAWLANHDGEPNFRRVPYEGTVYCASVPNQTLITRRNGKTLVSGNSLEYLVAYVSERFEEGSAYVQPEYAAGRGSPAYQAAKAMLAEENKQSGNYVHLGPGAAAH